jgi:hypothetical protein
LDDAIDQPDQHGTAIDEGQIMPRRFHIILAASITAVVAPASHVAAGEAPKQEGCDMVALVGHVPGRLDRVWVIRCIDADGNVIGNQRPSADPGPTRTLDHPRRPLLHHT